jgi:hypothetical protein
MHTMSARFDLYSAIHKALRHCMGAALLQLGRLDLSDEREVRDCSSALLGMVGWLEEHLTIEERFVHAALAERCRSPLLADLRRDHGEHERSFVLLRHDVAALVGTLGEDLEVRGARTRHLYLALSRFVGENFSHMAIEETELSPLLWQTFTDEELFGIYRAILASESPDQLGRSVSWLLPAIPPDERARVVGGARAALPQAGFGELLLRVRSVLAPRDYEKLVTALGQPAA